MSSRMLRLIFVVVALAQVCVSLGYVHGFPKACRSSSLVMSADSNMRSLSQHVKKASTAFIVGCMITTSFSSASLAAVGEGDLPPGALAFSKILKYQGDWKKLAATITSRPTEMDDKEILAAKAFMKSLANEYRDMELLSTGIMDKDKAQEARDTAKEFRKVVRACDDAATDSNMKKVAELYPESALLMDKYLGFLQDIPADL